MIVKDWLEKNVIALLRDQGIEVQEDAASLLLFACDNQLRTGTLKSEGELYNLLEEFLPHLVAAYHFKNGRAPMTFGRAICLLADMSERVKDVKRYRPQAA